MKKVLLVLGIVTIILMSSFGSVEEVEPKSSVVDLEHFAENIDKAIFLLNYKPIECEYIINGYTHILHTMPNGVVWLSIYSPSGEIATGPYTGGTPVDLLCAIWGSQADPAE